MKLRMNFTRGYVLQLLAAVSTNLSVVCCQMFYGWSSPAIPILTNGSYKFTISSKEASWLVVIPVLSQIIGSLGTGPLADIYGRKWIMVLSAIPYIFSWLLVGFATSITLMFIGRFIAGVFDGVVYTIIQMYIAEIADPRIRGFLGSIIPVSAICGVLFVNVIGSYLPIDTAAFVSTIVPIMLFFTFIWFPESPYYYLMKGKVVSAEKSLIFFRDSKDVSGEVERISTAINDQQKTKGRFLNLFTDKLNRKCLYLGLLLRAIDQLSGATPILFYTQTIFQESKSVLSPSTATIIFFSVQLLMTFVSSAIVDISGRRPLLIISIIGTTVALVLNGVYLYIKTTTKLDVSNLSFVPILALLMYVVFSSIGVQTVPFIMLGEIYSMNVKGFAMGVIYTYVGILMTLTSKFFHWSKDSYGLYVPFLTFAGCCVVLLILVIFLLPETKGKTLEDIQLELKNKF